MSNSCAMITPFIVSSPYGATAQGTFTLDSAVTGCVFVINAGTITVLIVDNVVVPSPYTPDLQNGVHTYLIGSDDQTSSFSRVTVNGVLAGCDSLPTGITTGLVVSDCNYGSASGSYSTTGAANSIIGFQDPNGNYVFPPLTYLNASLDEVSEAALQTSTAGTQYFTIDAYSGAGTQEGVIMYTSNGNTMIIPCPPVVVVPESSNVLLYVGIGVGIILFFVILYFLLRPKPAPTNYFNAPM